MSRALNDLSTPLRVKMFELIARLTERGVHVLIVDTLRTPEEHAKNLANGSSWATLSKHLPRSLRGYPKSDVEAERSDACDIVPYEVFQADGPDKLAWRVDHPHWPIIRDEAERLGLRSGARFRPPAKPDLGHVELYLR